MVDYDQNEGDRMEVDQLNGQRNGHGLADEA